MILFGTIFTTSAAHAETRTVQLRHTEPAVITQDCAGSGLTGRAECVARTIESGKPRAGDPNVMAIATLTVALRAYVEVIKAVRTVPHRRYGKIVKVDWSYIVRIKASPPSSPSPAT
jgi:hypothetical protein